MDIVPSPNYRYRLVAVQRRGFVWDNTGSTDSASNRDKHITRANLGTLQNTMRILVYEKRVPSKCDATTLDILNSEKGNPRVREIMTKGGRGRPFRNHFAMIREPRSWPTHCSSPSNSFIRRWISSSSFSRSARIAFGTRCSIASCTTSL
jgi:hypothetical protein